METHHIYRGSRVALCSVNRTRAFLQPTPISSSHLTIALKPSGNICFIISAWLLRLGPALSILQFPRSSFPCLHKLAKKQTNSSLSLTFSPTFVSYSCFDSTSTTPQCSGSRAVGAKVTGPGGRGRVRCSGRS